MSLLIAVTATLAAMLGSELYSLGVDGVAIHGVAGFLDGKDVADFGLSLLSASGR